MDTYYIYRIENLLNGHDYIGKKKRLKTIDPLVDNYFGSGIRIKEAINKYGIQNFKKEILEDNLSMENASMREVYWISKYKGEGKAYYNISPGLEGISKSVEFIDKNEVINFNRHISNKLKDYWNLLSEEDKKIRSLSMKTGWEEMSSNKKEEFSKVRSQIQKDVYKNTSENKKISINEKRKKSLKEMHKNRTEDQKIEINNKISKSLIDYNKSLTEDQKAKISEVLSKSQKEYLKRETEEHRRKRSINQSIAQGDFYKIQDPNGKTFIIKSLNLWCKFVFKEKWNCASVSLKTTKTYKGYYIIEKLNPESIDDSITFNDYLKDESRIQVDSKSQLP